MKSILVVTVLYIVAGGTGGNAACDFSEENCKAVGALMGRTLKSSSAYSTKGCYLYYIEKYGSDIYYGTGGSEAERNSKLPRFEAKKERPPGFDCKRVNFLAQSEKTECKAGTSKITTATKCRKAAKELGIPFARTAHWTDKPGGCFHNWGINIEGKLSQVYCRRDHACAYFNSYIGSTGKTLPPICEN